ncbi:MAG: glycosyltransferase family 2 protein [Streptococcaceae bacterium]|jgi:glycosyltransferase involved in cell wall biosynthesis|nr:glycosyltransferase family 2 protein [Streptococcaceae bacterium]
MMTPDLSIIFPAYNVADYISDAIRSVLAVSNLTVELIVVDDGSTDNLTEALREFEGLSNLIVVHQANQGAGIARNKGLEAATGNYVLFMDPDDRINAAALEEVFAETKKQPEMVIFAMSLKNATTHAVTTPNYALPAKRYEENADLVADLCTHQKMMTYTPPWNKLIRRDFLGAHPELRFTDQRTGQDVLFAIDLWNIVNKAVWCPTPAYCYTLGRAEGASHKRRPQFILDAATICAKLLRDCPDKRVADDLIVSYGMRELRFCKPEAGFFNYLAASPLKQALSQVRFFKLPWGRKLQYLTRRIPLTAYVYYRLNQ